MFGSSVLVKSNLPLRRKSFDRYLAGCYVSLVAAFSLFMNILAAAGAHLFLQLFSVFSEPFFGYSVMAETYYKLSSVLLNGLGHAKLALLVFIILSLMIGKQIIKWLCHGF